MMPLNEREIRAAFVNCSKGEASRLHLPRDLAATRWENLDYLGWRDPQAPARAHVVVEHAGAPVGVALRAPGGGKQRGMCSLCASVRSGAVELMVAPRAGKAGRQGHSVGTYICGDLACSLLVRDLMPTGAPRMYETLSVDQRVARLGDNLAAFVRRVLRAA